MNPLSVPAWISSMPILSFSFNSSTSALPLTSQDFFESLTMVGSTRSVSSMISPTISSKTSSMVIRPVIEPCSFTTIAMCSLLFWNNLKRESSFFASGTKRGFRISFSTVTFCLPLLMYGIMSLTCSTPTIFSLLFSYTGSLVNCFFWLSVSTSLSLALALTITISALLVMTSERGMSSNSKMRWIIVLSNSLMAPSSSPIWTMLFNSSSVMVGWAFLMPMTLSIILRINWKNFTTGHSTMLNPQMKGAKNNAKGTL